jgi:hypothetical protein
MVVTSLVPAGLDEPAFCIRRTMTIEKRNYHVMPRASGASSNHSRSGDYWIARFRGR